MNCGHTGDGRNLLGAATRLTTDRGHYAGRLMVVIRPAEELSAGADAMVKGGLFERFGQATVEHTDYFPPLINDEPAVARTRRRSGSGSERSDWSTRHRYR